MAIETVVRSGICSEALNIGFAFISAGQEDKVLGLRERAGLSGASDVERRSRVRSQPGIRPERKPKEEILRI